MLAPWVSGGDCLGRDTPGMVRDLGKGSLEFSAPEVEF